MDHTQQTLKTLVLKTSWRRLQDMSWKRLQHIFSVTTLRFPRRLEDVLQRRLEDILQDVLKTSWRRLGRRKIVTLRTSWRRLEDMSWRHVLKTYLEDTMETLSFRRHYGDKQNTCWGYLYITNLNVYLANLYFINLYLTLVRRIQNALIKTQWFHYCSYFGTQASSLF